MEDKFRKRKPRGSSWSTLLNVGRIDYADSFALYKEGITKHTVRLLHAIELERLTLGRKLGFELLTAKKHVFKEVI